MRVFLSKSVFRIRILTGIICAIFLAEQIAFAAPLSLAGVYRPQIKYSLDQVIQDPTKLEIPFEHCSLKEFHKGTNGKLVIHIQDAHSNLSGQKSLAAILNHVGTKYDISTVLLEGGDRDVTLDEVKVWNFSNS